MWSTALLPVSVKQWAQNSTQHLQLSYISPHISNLLLIHIRMKCETEKELSGIVSVE